MSEEARLRIGVDPSAAKQGAAEASRAIEGVADAAEQSAARQVRIERERQVQMQAIRDRNAQLDAEYAEKQRQRAIRTASARAQGIIDAMERTFQADMARIREASARGLLTPAAAEQAGRDAAIAYNQGILANITRMEGEVGGSMVLRGGAGREAFTEMANSLKDVDEASRRANVSMGRIHFTMGSLAARATGTSPVLGQLAGALSTMARGSALTVGVLAGIAAIGFSWNRLTQDAREIKRETDEAIKSLEKLAEQRAGGTLAEQTRLARAELDRLEARRQQLEAQAAGMGGTGRDEFGVERERAARRLNDLLEERAGLLRAIEAADTERLRPFHEILISTEAHIDQQQRLLAARGRGEAAVDAVTNQIRREVAVKAALVGVDESLHAAVIAAVHARYDLVEANERAEKAERDRVAAAREAAREAERAAKQAQQENEQREQRIASLAVELDAQQRLHAAHREGSAAVEALKVVLAGEAAARSLGAGATEDQIAAARAHAEAIERERQAIQKLIDTQREAERVAREVARVKARAAREAERAAERANRQMMRGLNDLGRAIGGNIEQALALVTAIMQLERVDLSTRDGMVAAAVGSASFGAGVGASTANPAMGAMGGAAGGFAIAGPMGAAAGAAAGLASGLMAMVAASNEATRALRRHQQALRDQLRALELGAFGSTLEQQQHDLGTRMRGMLDANQDALRGQELRDANAAVLDLWKRLEEQLRETHAALQAQFAEDLEVRALRAQGMDTEADALALRLRHEREYVEMQKQGLDAETLARLDQVQAMEREKQARDATTDSMRNLTNALNAPDGIRLSLRAWQASLLGVGQGSSGPPDVGGWRNRVRTPETADSAGSLMVVFEAGAIVQQPGENGAELANRVVESLSAKSRLGGGNPLARVTSR